MTLSYGQIGKTVRDWRPGQVKRKLLELDHAFTSSGIDCFGSSGRYLFGRLIQVHPEVPALKSLSGTAQENIKELKRRNQGSYTRIAAEIYADKLQCGEFGEICRERAVPGAPLVVFVSSLKQKEQSGFRVGSRPNINPPLGVLGPVSLLNLLGIETHLLNLDLAEQREALPKMLERRPAAVSLLFSSLFHSQKDFDIVLEMSNLWAEQKKEGRLLMAGGRVAKFVESLLFAHTPVQFVPRGSIAMGELILDLYDDSFKYYQNPQQVLNLYWKDNGVARETPPDSLPPHYRRLIDRSVDHRTIDYLAHWSGLPANLHPENLMHGTKWVRTLSGHGVCKVECDFCAFTHSGSPFKPEPIEDTIEKAKEAVKFFPQAELLTYCDDDFTLRRMKPLLEKMAKAPVFKGLPVYFEAYPLRFPLDLVPQMRKAGVAVVLFGTETAAPRSLIEMKKIKKIEDYQNFIDVPLKANKAGLYVRVSGMLTHPTTDKDDLMKSVEVYTGYVMHGIDVILYPAPEVRPGSEIDSQEKFMATSRWGELITFPDKSRKRFRLDVLPEDEFVREILLRAVDKLGNEKAEFLKKEAITWDYPDSLDVLLFLKLIMSEWLAKERSPQAVELDRQVEGALGLFLKRSIQQQRIKEFIDQFEEGDRISEVSAAFPGIPHDLILFTLNRYLLLGNLQMKKAALKIINSLGIKLTSDKNIADLVEFYLEHPDEEIRSSAKAINI